MEINQFIAEKIKKIRVNSNLSQEKLALKADLDRTYVQSIEAGRRNISVNVLVRVCKALDYNASDILLELEKNLSQGSINNL